MVMYNESRPIARYSLGKWGCFSGESGFFALFLEESGPYFVRFWKKVDLFACFFGESGLFHMFTACLGACSLRKFCKTLLKIMHSGTMI